MRNEKNDIKIRECTTLEELAECVQVQREVFALPECELSPVRHLVVTKNAGGFSLGAYDGERLAGFVLSVPAYINGRRAFYSHMTGVRPEYQSHGLGAKLKWAQRARALAEGVDYIRWTFEPIKARNAFFNLEKLGAVVREYRVNFYGTDYGTSPELDGMKLGLASDRLMTDWELNDPKVAALAAGETPMKGAMMPVGEIVTVEDWLGLVAENPEAAKAEQLRIRSEFQVAFASGFVASGFTRDSERPAFLLY
ncbi:MAG TPA: GNAT family N-acetyltransferase [Pyrinomonadaceae bacterium]|nr:GNAT family N-acetyltransferase [Pyrinomonadaceae bacterium]